MSGSAAVEFEPDYYRFCIKIEPTAETAEKAVTVGKRITENLLAELENRLNIRSEDVIAGEEGTTYYNEADDAETFEFSRKLYITVDADHGITESITDIIKGFECVYYSIKPLISNRSEKEKLVINSAVEDSRSRAEMLISSLGCNITGFEEIEYNYRDSYSPSVCHKIGDVKRSVSKASRLANEKIIINKDVSVVWLTD